MHDTAGDADTATNTICVVTHPGKTTRDTDDGFSDSLEIFADPNSLPRAYIAFSYFWASLKTVIR